jgi:phenylalanyl-tRNA synthetase beta chain
MKVTLNWLKQYVDFDWSPEELAERLTMLGIEVENVQKLGGEFEGVVVAEVLTREKHPNADKLSLCRVNDGKGERQIVCGAQNFKAGDKVPLILPGASLPLKAGEKEPLTIKVGKIRGVESHGMLCSPKELGLAGDADGLLILREDAKIGQPFAEYLGRAGSDVVYDLEITPNRPDLNSVIGIAREISAVTGNAVRIPEVRSQKSELRTEALVAVRVEDAELCPRYTARVIRGVKVGPSPDWLKSTLEKVGVRSISNVVDVTNYVMLEIGQPLHAFDYHLAGQASRLPQTVETENRDRRNACPTIVIRRAVEGEKFMTLDGQERTLTNQMLLIADETRAIALAGIMGGANSEINLKTTDVLIESAYFKRQNIRSTSRKLELRTESSYRFERGADVEICDWASQRAAQLILETAGGQLAEGIVDAYPKRFEPKQITLRYPKTDELLGLEISSEQQANYLKRLGLEQVNGSSFRIPSFRVDLKREADLIEEVARLHGVEKIPATPPRGAIGANDFDTVHDEIADAREILTGLGLNEAQGQTLIADAAAKLVTSESVALQNPLSSDMNVLRPSLLPGLLDALRHNVNHKNYDITLFEIGRTFQPEQNGAVKENRRLAIAMTGQRQALFWSGEERGAKFDSSDLKGVLEEFFDQFGVRGLTYTRRNEATSLLLESATIHLGKQQVGELGLLSPTLAKRYDLRDAVLLAELNFDLLLVRRSKGKSFKPLPAFPAIRRDVAMLVPEATTHEAVLQTVRKTRAQNLESVELFDVFRGTNVPEGQKSLAYAFTYRSAERTLTDAEVNSAHERLVAELKQNLAAVIREH